MADGEVAAVDPVAGEAANAEPAAAGGGVWPMLKGLVTRMIMIYMFSMLMRQWRGSPAPSNSTMTTTSDGQSIAQRAMPPSTNLFHKHMHFDLFVYLSDAAHKFTEWDNEAALFWHADGLEYGDWTSGDDMDGVHSVTHTIEAPAVVRANGSYFMHVFVVKSGDSPNPQSRNYNRAYTIHKTYQLNKFKKKRYEQRANLLTGETEQTDEEVEKAALVKYEILNHWHSNITINIVEDYTAWTAGTLPPPLNEYIHFDAAGATYQPIVYFNDYWNLVKDYTLVNETVQALNLSVTYQPMSLFKWQLYASQQMKNKWMMMGMGDGEEENQDSLKEAILETNPILLGTTVVVSLLHTVFEFLAFKNDIQFWKSRKSMEGLSVRSVLFNVFVSFIMLLYILDNDTNFVVKMSVGVGLLIEMWKVPKCMDVSIDRENKWFGIIPRIVFKDKGSYASATKEYDQQAFKYLSWLLYPLIVCYAIYSLMYQEHRGWYSWVLSMAYGFLLTFGFIMMTPQLFINYKLKSVAHLPWRMLSYKFINTFIDDLFAFVIKMPTLYRLGCFRDDIVFLVYVYQRWAYRVDMTRVNEFGTSGVEPEGVASVDGTPAATDAIEGTPTAVDATTKTTTSTPTTTRQRKKGKKSKSSDVGGSTAEESQGEAEKSENVKKDK